MSRLTQTDVDRVLAACDENREAIARSLNLCFDRTYRIAAGETTAWSAAAAGELDGPGLIIAFQVGEQGVLCLIPQSLPLPDWHSAPASDDESRLQALSLEWSINILPADMEVDDFRQAASDNLRQQVIDSQPAAWAKLVELLVFDEAAGDEAEPAARIFVVVAVDQLPFPAAPPARPSTPAAVPAAGPSLPALRQIDRQLLDLPVTVSVRLAEKKIEVGQLISMTPGGLVTFNKGCESLLDLYVNDHLYGRGEAIKIGEKFGLKITQVGVTPQRKPRVL